MDSFFSSAALDLLGGPSIASLNPFGGGGLFGSSATSSADGTQTATVSVPFVQSSPFNVGDGNKTGDVGTGSTSAAASSNAPAAGGIAKIADALGPMATLVALTVGVIALLKAVRR